MLWKKSLVCAFDLVLKNIQRHLIKSTQAKVRLIISLPLEALLCVPWKEVFFSFFNVVSEISLDNNWKFTKERQKHNSFAEGTGYGAYCQRRWRPHKISLEQNKSFKTEVWGISQVVLFFILSYRHGSAFQTYRVCMHRTLHGNTGTKNIGLLYKII